jgi:hypothetical protein
MNKIFLIGRRRTGIQTASMALTVLGYKKKTMLTSIKSEKIEDLIEEMKDLDVCAITRDYSMNEIRAIEAVYPSSTFFLTKRHSHIWYASFVRYFLSKKGDNPQTDYSKKGHYVSTFYEGYNEEIKHHFTGREWKLLTMTLDGSHNWGQICSYYKKPIPSTSFPHVNRS